MLSICMQLFTFVKRINTITITVRKSQINDNERRQIGVLQDHEYANISEIFFLTSGMGTETQCLCTHVYIFVDEI